MQKWLLLLFVLPQGLTAQRGDTEFIATITQLKSYTGPAVKIYVADSNVFYQGCTSCTQKEQGMIKGTSGKKWKKVTDTAVITKGAVVTTIAGLRSLTTPLQQTRYYTSDNNRKGLWKWIPFSTAADNEGTILAPDNGSAGRFFRDIQNGIVHSEWFNLTAGDTSNMQTSKLQAAIDFQSANHYVLKIASGTYWIEQASLPSHTRIDGDGKVVFRTKSAARSGSYVYLFRAKGVTDIKITDLEFNMSNVHWGNLYSGVTPMVFDGCTDITIENCYCYNNIAGFLRFGDVQYVWVRRCRATRTDTPFQFITGQINHVWISECEANGGQSEGIGFSVMTKGSVVQDIHILNNTVKNFKNSAGIALCGVRNGVVTGNRTDSCYLGIMLTAPEPPAHKFYVNPKGSRNTVTYNAFYNNLGTGIKGQSDSSLIARNQIVNSGSHGIDTRTGYGEVWDTTAVIAMNIRDNLIDSVAQDIRGNGGTAIRLYKVKNAVVSGNKGVVKKKASFGYGMEVCDLQDVVISNNSFPDGNGLVFRGSQVYNKTLSIRNNTFATFDNFKPDYSRGNTFRLIFENNSFPRYPSYLLGAQDHSGVLDLNVAPRQDTVRIRIDKPVTGFQPTWPYRVVTVMNVSKAGPALVQNSATIKNLKGSSLSLGFGQAVTYRTDETGKIFSELRTKFTAK